MGFDRGLLRALACTGLLAGTFAMAPMSWAGPVQLPSLADEASKLLPSVVVISSTQGERNEDSSDSAGDNATPTPRMPGAPQAEIAPEPDSPSDEGGPFQDFFNDFLKKNNKKPGASPRSPAKSLGSGFVIDSAGLIVTNNHVIEHAMSTEVTLSDGTVLMAEIVGRDPKMDLAVLRVKPAKPLPAVKWGNSDKLRVGDWVMAIGNPFGLGGSVSLGIVSARNRNINSGPYDDFIQTDTAINQGNSGGPLFDLAGDVVGINTAIFSPTGGSVGIGFAIPSDTARSVVGQLIKFGEVRRGWLGVNIQPVTEDLLESLHMTQARGALISDVTADGPAAKGGVLAGDVIVMFDNRTVREMKDLPRIVAETEIGKAVPVMVVRKGSEMPLTVTVGKLAGDSKTPAVAKDKPQTVNLLGMTVGTLDDATRSRFMVDKALSGAVVLSVEPDGAAANRMLAMGDVITEAGEKPVTTPSDVEARATEAKKAGKSSLLLLVAKAGKAAEMRFVALRLEK